MEDYTQGTQVGAPLIPGSPQDTYPTHYTALGHGGWRSVADIAARDSITMDRRSLGMRVKCVAEDILFELKGGFLNVNWEVVKRGGIVSSENSPIEILEIWTGSQEEFKAVKSAGISESTIYNFTKIKQIVREPSEPVSFLLTEWDNETNQIVLSDCNFRLSSIVGKFNCSIIVAQDVLVNLYGGTDLIVVKNGTRVVGDAILSMGIHYLYRLGDSSTFILC